jgi:voltage-gated potassium channel
VQLDRVRCRPEAPRLAVVQRRREPRRRETITPNGARSATTKRRGTGLITARGLSVVVTLVAAGAVVLGGSTAWLVERDAPGRTFGSWADALWWAVTTLTTVGYGDHVPVTPAGRVVGATIMIIGVAVLGGVAAVVALVVAQAVAATEEQALEAEAEAVERRIEARLDTLDARLARIEDRLRFLGEPGSR